MKHVIDRARNRNEVADVDLHQTKTFAPLQMSNVIRVASNEIVEAHDVNAIVEESLREVRTNEACPASQNRASAHDTPQFRASPREENLAVPCGER